MTDMPERIFAWRQGQSGNEGYWFRRDRGGSVEKTEYVRADLYEELRKRAKERIRELDPKFYDLEGALR